MEYSITNRQGERFDFKSLNELFEWIRKRGEIDGWILRIHHM